MCSFKTISARKKTQSLLHGLFLFYFLHFISHWPFLHVSMGFFHFSNVYLLVYSDLTWPRRSCWKDRGDLIKYAWVCPPGEHKAFKAHLCASVIATSCFLLVITVAIVRFFFFICFLSLFLIFFAILISFPCHHLLNSLCAPNRFPSFYQLLIFFAGVPHAISIFGWFTLLDLFTTSIPQLAPFIHFSKYP